MSRISKIILFDEDSFFFAIKRVPSNADMDRKLELLGGGVDKGETPFQGLIRELAEEEESAVIAHRVAILQLSPVRIVVEGDRHFIYHSAITGKELEKVRMSDKEHYGYQLIPKSTIMAPDGINRSLFTRRTVKIFSALRRIGHFPYEPV